MCKPITGHSPNFVRDHLGGFSGAFYTGLEIEQHDVPAFTLSGKILDGGREEVIHY